MAESQLVLAIREFAKAYAWDKSLIRPAEAPATTAAIVSNTGTIATSTRELFFDRELE